MQWIPKKSDKCDPKPVWVHAWKVNHGGDFLNTTIDGVLLPTPTCLGKKAMLLLLLLTIDRVI